MSISSSHIYKSFGAQDVLRDVSFSLTTGEHAGLVGANGVGKSTLLRILARDEEPDDGTISLPEEADVGYLPQSVTGYADMSIDDLILESLGKIRTLETRLRALEGQMAHAVGLELDGILAEYAEITEQFERRGGYEVDYRIETVLEGMRIGHISRNRLVSSLSGGEKARVALAALLLRSPDLLLLDEPTNHLDFATLEWLGAYLKEQPGAALVASHDRHFLNATVSTIFELNERSRELKRYVGDYDAFVVAKAGERARWEEAYEAQQEEIRELTRAAAVTSRQVGHNRSAPDRDKITHKYFGERVQKTISRNVRSAEEKLRRIRENPIPKPPDPMRINPRFDADALTSRVPLVAQHLSKSYGSRVVLDDLSFGLESGRHVVLTGPNGAGKSTLIRILAGVQIPDNGTVSAAPGLRIGYLDQEQESVDDSRTVFDEYREGLIGHEDELRSQLFRYALFTQDDLKKTVRDLSIGQKRKLQIAIMIARHPNLLLLDEPTNHISLDILEEFEEALLSFPGPVLAVSHDRRFIEHFAQEVWEVRAGRLIIYPDGFESYLAMTEATSAV